MKNLALYREVGPLRAMPAPPAGDRGSLHVRVAAVPVASAREAAAAEGSPLERLAEAAMSRSSAMV